MLSDLLVVGAEAEAEGPRAERRALAGHWREWTDKLTAEEKAKYVFSV